MMSRIGLTSLKNQFQYEYIYSGSPLQVLYWHFNLESSIECIMVYSSLTRSLTDIESLYINNIHYSIPYELVLIQT